MIPLKDILAENRSRHLHYFRDYSRESGDPLSETVKRVEIPIGESRLYLPEAMLKVPIVAELKEHGSFKKILLKTQGRYSVIAEKKLIVGLIEDRFQYDFEFWAVTCIKIQDKISKVYIPFKLNRGQRRLLALFEEQRLAGVPIRTILVKARQWGGSTLTQMYMLWLQLFHYENWHSAIISQLKVQATNVRNMILKTIAKYPKEHAKPTIKTVHGTQNMKYIVERGCEIQVGSAEEPDAIRSFDLAMAHMTEIAFWANTQTKSGEDLVQSLYATIPDVPGTFVMMESTAKGIGDFFHEQWLAATAGSSQYRPIFVPWFEIEMYTMKVNDYEKFVNSFGEYEWWQWKQGATLEGINWYRTYKRAKSYSDFSMKSEYPTTAEESFQSSAGTYFRENIIEQARATCEEPIWKGDIRGNSFTGPNALLGITLFEKDTGGSEILQIWQFPDKYDEEKMLYQYIVIVDIGGKTHKSDNSIISVLDRSALIDPFGAMERVALWYGHVDHDILAWKAAQIAEYYNHALLVIESNTIDSRDKKQMDTILYEGDHFYTVINELADVYDNLYARGGSPDKAIDNGMPTKFGWHMNKKTKYQAYDRYAAAYRDYEFIEKSHEAVNEMQWLQLKSNGQIEAASGKRDDIQDTNAIGVYIGFEDMPLPKIVKVEPGGQGSLRQKKSVGVAGF